MSSRPLTLYWRAGCSLCESMIQHVQAQQGQLDFALALVDIDGDPELIRRYGERIPVLEGEEGEICHYFFDREAFGRYFAAP